MKKLITAFVLYSFMMPMQAQVLKKLKGQFENKFKEKIEQKKDQKIDEKADNLATKIINTPDSIVKKTGALLKEKQQAKKDTLKTNDLQKNDTLNHQVSQLEKIDLPSFSSSRIKKLQHPTNGEIAVCCFLYKGILPNPYKPEKRSFQTVKRIQSKILFFGDMEC